MHSYRRGENVFTEREEREREGKRERRRERETLLSEEFSLLNKLTDLSI